MHRRLMICKQRTVACMDGPAYNLAFAGKRAPRSGLFEGLLPIAATVHQTPAKKDGTPDPSAFWAPGTERNYL
jgi:hypothetical protein